MEQDAGREADHGVAAGLSGTNDPRQGARLVRAFLRITDPKVRLIIIDMVEKMESAAAQAVAITQNGD